MPLSKSAFTIIPPYISIFSTLMFSHTSLSILNVLFTSLYSSLSLTAPFGASVHVLSCCTFFFMGYTTSSQFYYSFFLSTLYSGRRIFLLSHSDTFLTIVSLLPHFTHSTLIILFLFASLSLQFYASWYRLYHIFLTCLSRKNPCL